MKVTGTILSAIVPLTLLFPNMAHADIAISTGTTEYVHSTPAQPDSDPTVTDYEYPGAVTANVSDTTQSFDIGCIDIFHNGHFNWSSSDFVSASSTIYPRSDVANALLQLATASFGSGDTGHTTSAFQTEVWDIVNETGDNDNPSNGRFTAPGAPNDSNPSTPPWPSTNTPTYTVPLLHNDIGQESAVAAMMQKPGTLALIYAGLICVAALHQGFTRARNRRLKRRKALELHKASSARHP